MPTNLSPVPKFLPGEELSKNAKLFDWMTQTRDMVNRGKTPTVETTISATVAIKPTTDILRVISSTAIDTTITANPRIISGHDGQSIELEGLDDTKTVTLKDGNGIKLTGGADMVLGKNDIILFRYNKDQDLWIERYRANN